MLHFRELLSSNKLPQIVWDAVATEVPPPEEEEEEEDRGAQPGKSVGTDKGPGSGGIGAVDDPPRKKRHRPRTFD